MSITKIDIINTGNPCYMPSFISDCPKSSNLFIKLKEYTSQKLNT